MGCSQLGRRGAIRAKTPATPTRRALVARLSGRLRARRPSDGGRPLHALRGSKGVSIAQCDQKTRVFPSANVLRLRDDLALAQVRESSKRAEVDRLDVDDQEFQGLGTEAQCEGDGCAL